MCVSAHVTCWWSIITRDPDTNLAVPQGFLRRVFAWILTVKNKLSKFHLNILIFHFLDTVEGSGTFSWRSPERSTFHHHWRKCTLWSRPGIMPAMLLGVKSSIILEQDVHFQSFYSISWRKLFLIWLVLGLWCPVNSHLSAKSPPSLSKCQ